MHTHTHTGDDTANCRVYCPGRVRSGGPPGQGMLDPLRAFWPGHVRSSKTAKGGEPQLPVCGFWQRAGKKEPEGKKVKNAHGCVTRVGARGRPQRCRWCTPRRVRRSLLDSPPGAGSAPTSRLFSPHSGARWHIWCSGGSLSGHRTAKRYPYSRRTFRHPLSSRDDPRRRWIHPGINRGTEAWY